MVIINKIINIIKNKKGQQLVEFAAILPVMVLAMGIIITSGQLIFAKMTAQMAAYEGARQAVVQTNYGVGKSLADQKASSVLQNGIGLAHDADYTTMSTNGAWSKGNLVTYTVHTQVKTLFPVLNTNFKTDSVHEVTGKMVMMIERNP